MDGQVRALQERLRLTHWDIEVVPMTILPDAWAPVESEEIDEYAHVTMRQADRKATITVHPKVAKSTPFWYECVRHEMLHILMTDLEYIASNGRSIELMELYNREQERVINVLASALGQEAES